MTVSSGSVYTNENATEVGDFWDIYAGPKEDSRKDVEKDLPSLPVSEGSDLNASSFSRYTRVHKAAPADQGNHSELVSPSDPKATGTRSFPAQDDAFDVLNASFSPPVAGPRLHSSRPMLSLPLSNTFPSLIASKPFPGPSSMQKTRSLPLH